jgi:tetratricopeptide (TPR) repeat protein
MAIKFTLAFFCLIVISSMEGMAQSSVYADSTSVNVSNSMLNTKANKLLYSISENRNADEIAENYYALAIELSKSGDYTKAETYMNKAIQIEISTKNSKKLSEYYRELAKIQEALNKTNQASESFIKASELSETDLQKQINKNDANRLKYKSTPQVELKFLNQNATLLNNSSDKTEKIFNLTQMANTNMALDNNEEALANYKDALTITDSTSDNAIQIKSDMANLLAETKNYDQAIAVQKEVVELSETNSSVEKHVEQLRNLSTLYFTTNNVADGLSILQKAYKLAVEKGSMDEAKKSLLMLAGYYEKKKESIEVLKLYKDFIGHIENLVANDSTLIDKNIFLINEGKISQLEKEKVLKDEIIVRKNKYNYVLIGSVLLLLILLVLIVKAWVSIKNRNKRIALQSLRREMNPHFIFNSLNSVNQFIAGNNELEANKYLTSYSNLMRNMMENSNKDYVTINTELDQLTKYLELEKLRFADKFDYQIEVDEKIDKDSEMVPNMIIQPNLENAIWHGLRYKESKGLLTLKFCKVGLTMKAEIEDNGIGLMESQNIKTKNQKLHDSLGLKNVKERIRLLNEIYKSDIRFEITEKQGAESGVKVKIEW